MEPLDRAFDSQFGAEFRDVFHDAIAAPGTVNAHHVRVDATFEGNALAFSPFCNHGLLPLSAAGFLTVRRLWAQIKGKLANKT
jgi:hypothetical protein